MRILLIDDDPDIGPLVKAALRPYIVEQTMTLQASREALAKKTYDLFLIDVSLPDGNGFDLCREIAMNPTYSQTPLIFLTARTETSEVVFGLSSGADDYITKPFHTSELKARVEARFRKLRANQAGHYRKHVFEFDTEFQKCVSVEGDAKVDLGLTPTEFRILLTLARNEGSIISRDDLVNSLWQSGGLHIAKRGVDSHIAHLRRKLGKYGNVVATFHGRGYSFVTEGSAAPVADNN